MENKIKPNTDKISKMSVQKLPLPKNIKLKPIRVKPRGRG